MKVTLAQVPAAELRVDALAIPIAAGGALEGLAADCDRALGGLLQQVLDAGEHRGRINEVLPVQTGGRISARRVLLYGIGPERDLDGQRLRFAHHELVRAARTYGYRRLGIVRAGGLDGGSLAAVVEGAVMGSWEMRSHQTGDAADRARLEELILSGYGENREHDLVLAEQVGDAVNQAREWQNTPPNQLTPTRLAEEAQRIATRHGMEFEVLGPDELRAGGYNLLLGVAAGSAQQPRLFRMHHRGAPGAEGSLALIGKGITFDSGGLSLKTHDGMVRMKGDMAGAAAVLAAMNVIGARRLPANVIGVVAATENMTGPAAQRPGDIVVSASGKTVEVLNTDAEGRLVLGDAVTYAIRHGATRLVDLATLTGAATIAIGHAATAALANDEELWGLVEQASKEAGDRVWRMPIYPEYRGLLNSKVADLKNSYYGEAGMITGGMFIGQFVEGRPWVHLDIAASSWNDNEQLKSVPRGPLGAGTRLCIRLAELTASTAR